MAARLNGAGGQAQGERPKAEDQGVEAQGDRPKGEVLSEGQPSEVEGTRAAGRTGNTRRLSSFVLKNLIVWVLMVVVLVLVPDTLEPWLGIEIARVIGWGVAFPVWMIVVERDWQTRFGPMTRVALQVPLWIAAALLAIWISEQAGTRAF